ncbi:hypothetical protein NC652_028261 [Populus alba x Populus x berolinensis]|nr:hypothetical protein NC652_028261 [Populus alba x Populus x berolinensis]
MKKLSGHPHDCLSRPDSSLPCHDLGRETWSMAIKSVADLQPVESGWRRRTRLFHQPRQRFDSNGLHQERQRFQATRGQFQFDPRTLEILQLDP